ncbi:MAG: ComF family protein [Lachnospiraceae bacterium]|nr:ComF family protein [Lachnospiraceae bacterium]
MNRWIRAFPEALYKRTLNAVFPPRCAICDDCVTPDRRGICAACGGQLRILRGPSCLRCGRTLPRAEAEEEYCADCAGQNHAYDRCFSLFAYRDIAKSIYRFKYMGRQEYAAFYAEAFVRRYRRELKSLCTDALLPVPLSRKRRGERGYNQAELFACEIAKRTGIPVRTDVLARIRDTKPQKCLDYYERHNNLKNAFIIKKNDVSLKSVAIVDDIYTTGSTADALASLLKRNGVRSVHVFTVATGADTPGRIKRERAGIS